MASDGSCNGISSSDCLMYFSFVSGSKLRIPFMHRFTVSCFPNVSQFVLLNNDDKVGWAVAIEE